MAASRIDRTPRWLIKQAIFSYLDKLENIAIRYRSYLRCLPAHGGNESEEPVAPQDDASALSPGRRSRFLPNRLSRRHITAARRRPETDAVSMLERRANAPPVAERHKPGVSTGGEIARQSKSASGRFGYGTRPVQEFSLSSQEGVALMCLAEALRIPDKARDALIRDIKSVIATGSRILAVARRCSLTLTPLGALLFTVTGLQRITMANLSGAR